MRKHQQIEPARAVPGAKPIDAVWRSFAERVIPAEIGTIQRMECRRAFYAGAAATFAVTLARLEGCLTDDDLTLIEIVKAELDSFAGDLLTEHA